MIYRYSGKQDPSKIMGEICWRSKILFKDDDFQKMQKIHVESEQMEFENEEEDEMNLYEDSEDDDDHDDDSSVTEFMDEDDVDQLVPPPSKKQK